MKQFEFNPNFKSNEIDYGKLLIDNERLAKEYILNNKKQF